MSDKTVKYKKMLVIIGLTFIPLHFQYTSVYNRICLQRLYRPNLNNRDGPFLFFFLESSLSVYLFS